MSVDSDIQHLVVFVTMEMFVLWADHISMRAEWKCVLMIHGGQCVMTLGTMLMPLLSASSLDLHIPGVCSFSLFSMLIANSNCINTFFTM